MADLAELMDKAERVSALYAKRCDIRRETALERKWFSHLTSATADKATA